MLFVAEAPEPRAALHKRRFRVTITPPAATRVRSAARNGDDKKRKDGYQRERWRLLAIPLQQFQHAQVERRRPRRF